MLRGKAVLGVERIPLANARLGGHFRRGNRMTLIGQEIRTDAAGSFEILLDDL